VPDALSLRGPVISSPPSRIEVEAGRRIPFGFPPSFQEDGGTPMRGDRGGNPRRRALADAGNVIESRATRKGRMAAGLRNPWEIRNALERGSEYPSPVAA